MPQRSSTPGSQLVGPCRWGILGTATIARKNWQAIRNSGNGTLISVASRDLSRAQRFINECQSHVSFDPVPRALSSYEELLASPDVDAIYIPLPTGVRHEWAVKAANAGKHVVVEKPVGVNANEVQEILDACQKNNVQFMDGVMFMHSQRLPMLRQILDDGHSVGKIRRIATQFSFCAPDEFLKNNIRVHGELEPLGCLGDLGWYNIRFILWALKYDLPVRVSGRMLSEAGRSDSPSAVPMEFSGELFFANGISASFYCSFLTEHQQWAHISGSHGFVSLSDFVLPYFGSEVAFHVTNCKFDIRGCDFNMEEHTRRVAVHEHSTSTTTSQETNLFRNFGEIVRSGKLDPSWGEIALKTQKVLDACLASSRRDGAFVGV